MPNKLVKFNRYKHKKSTWIIRGLLTSIRYRDKIYKQLQLTNHPSNNYETININLKTYHKNVLRKIFGRLSKFILNLVFHFLGMIYEIPGKQ